MNRHRKATYIMRREILEAIDVSKRIQIFIEDEVAALAASSLVSQGDFEDILRDIFRLTRNYRSPTRYQRR